MEGCARKKDERRAVKTDGCRDHVTQYVTPGYTRSVNSIVKLERAHVLREHSIFPCHWI